MTKAEALNNLIAEETEREEAENPLPPAPLPVLTKEVAERKYEKSHSKANGENLHIIGEKQKPMRMPNGMEV